MPQLDGCNLASPTAAQVLASSSPKGRRVWGVVYWGLGFKVWVHSSVSALIKAPLTVRLDHLFGLGVWGFWGLGGSPTPNFTELKFCFKV